MIFINTVNGVERKTLFHSLSIFLIAGIMYICLFLLSYISGIFFICMVTTGSFTVP